MLFHGQVVAIWTPGLASQLTDGIQQLGVGSVIISILQAKDASSLLQNAASITSPYCPITPKLAAAPQLCMYPPMANINLHIFYCMHSTKHPGCLQEHSLSLERRWAIIGGFMVLVGAMTQSCGSCCLYILCCGVEVMCTTCQ